MANPQVAAAKPDTMPPAAHVFNLALNHFSARCLHMVAEAHVADHVTDTLNPQSQLQRLSVQMLTPFIGCCGCLP